jgi:proteasome lid subunit RPN8/RPN11
VESVTVEQPALDASQTALEALPEKTFPSARPFRVFISEQAYQTMWGHARESLSEGDTIREVGGILVGLVYRDEAGPYLEVTAAIPAEHTRSEGTEVAFTPETWAQINRVKDSRYPKDRIVGWYHTHPRFGIFLSERDKFVHRHSFPQPWAAAYVIDPVQRLEGLFLWSAGEPQQAQEYWVGPERKLWVPRETPSAESEDGAETRAEGVSRSAVLGGLTAVLITLLLVCGFFYRNQMLLAANMQIIGRALASDQQELDRSRQALAVLRSQFDRTARRTDERDEAMRAQLRQIESGLRNVDTITRLLRQRVDELRRDPASVASPASETTAGHGERGRP